MKTIALSTETTFIHFYTEWCFCFNTSYFIFFFLIWLISSVYNFTYCSKMFNYLSLGHFCFDTMNKRLNLFATMKMWCSYYHFILALKWSFRFNSGTDNSTHHSHSLCPSSVMEYHCLFYGRVVLLSLILIIYFFFIFAKRKFNLMHCFNAQTTA